MAITSPETAAKKNGEVERLLKLYKDKRFLQYLLDVKLDSLDPENEEDRERLFEAQKIFSNKDYAKRRYSKLFKEQIASKLGVNIDDAVLEATAGAFLEKQAVEDPEVMKEYIEKVREQERLESEILKAKKKFRELSQRKKIEKSELDVRVALIENAKESKKWWKFGFGDRDIKDARRELREKYKVKKDSYQEEYEKAKNVKDAMEALGGLEISLGETRKELVATVYVDSGLHDKVKETLKTVFASEFAGGETVSALAKAQERIGEKEKLEEDFGLPDDLFDEVEDSIKNILEKIEEKIQDKVKEVVTSAAIDAGGYLDLKKELTAFLEMKRIGEVTGEEAKDRIYEILKEIYEMVPSGLNKLALQGLLLDMKSGKT